MKRCKFLAVAIHLATQKKQQVQVLYSLQVARINIDHGNFIYICLLDIPVCANRSSKLLSYRPTEVNSSSVCLVRFIATFRLTVIRSLFDAVLAH